MNKYDNRYKSRERLLDVLDGKIADKIPVYTLVPFALKNEHLIPGAFHGYKDIDDWRIKDPLYTKLVNRMELEGDNFFVFRPASMDAQNIFISPQQLNIDSVTQIDGKIVKKYSVMVGSNKLTKTEKYIAHTGHSWITEHFCKNIDEALALLKIPWSAADHEQSNFIYLTKSLGDKGLFWITIPSPVMAVCRLFDPQDFLLFTALNRNKIDQLMQVAYTRIKDILIKLLELGYGPIIRFGGSEHATPPMMSPDDFDWLVVQYDTPLMVLCKRYKQKVAVHCHGNIRHAINRFMEMGVDLIDPVEALPFGDISLEEIRKITANQITLTGNIQFSELANESTEYIKDRVNELMKIAKSGRFIISTTGTPLEKLTQQLYDNYMTMMDCVK